VTNRGETVLVVGLLLAGCVVIVASGVAEVGGGRLVAVGGAPNFWPPG